MRSHRKVSASSAAGVQGSVAAQASRAGVVFKLGTAGELTVLHGFTGMDGVAPVAGLVRDAVGNPYGTTSGGGAFDYGMVFKLGTAGEYTVLYSFTGGVDGASSRRSGRGRGREPLRDHLRRRHHRPLLRLRSGVQAGPNWQRDRNVHLHRGSRWGHPRAGLVRDATGNLYGTTYGGTAVGYSGYGVVFKLSLGNRSF